MLLKLLAWLSTRFGQDVDTGRLIDLRLTYQDLSELLGATRVTVTRTLNQLEQQGLIERLPLQRIILREKKFGITRFRGDRVQITDYYQSKAAISSQLANVVQK